MMHKGSAPALPCIHTLAFSYPSNFLPQEFHDKDVKKRLTLSDLAVEVLLMTSPIVEKKYFDKSSCVSLCNLKINYNRS